MSADEYSSDVPLWYATVELDSGTQLEYKTVKEGDGNGVVWEPGENRSFTVPRECGVLNATVNDSWD